VGWWRGGLSSRKTVFSFSFRIRLRLSSIDASSCSPGTSNSCTTKNEGEAVKLKLLEPGSHNSIRGVGKAQGSAGSEPFSVQREMTCSS
jgi:hypothetical protein